jgi:hypothetical protein
MLRMPRNGGEWVLKLRMRCLAASSGMRRVATWFGGSTSLSVPLGDPYVNISMDPCPSIEVR